MIRDALLLLIGCMSGVGVGALFFAWLAKDRPLADHTRRPARPRVRTEITWRQ
jgi:hypothetical protein